MKKFIVLFVAIFLAIWWFQKNEDRVTNFFPSFSSSSPSTSSVSFVSSSAGITSSTIAMTFEKVKNWASTVTVFDGFQKVTSSPLKENFSDHVASFRFPAAYFNRSVREAIIDGGIGESFCTGTLKTGETLISQGEKVIAGVNAKKSIWSDAGAGNVYSGTVYSFEKENRCYALSLYIHSTQPENYASNESEAKQFRTEHEAALKKIQDTFEKMLNSFASLF